MSNRIITLITLLSALVSPFSATVHAVTPGDPIIRLDSTTKMELDLGMMIEELMPLVLESLAAEDQESAEVTTFLMDQLGLDALQLMELESRQTKEKSTSNITITFDKEKDGLLPRLLSTANGRCGFGKYVPRDELVMFMTAHNFSSYLETILDYLSRPEMVPFLNDMPVDENGELVFGGLNLRKDLLPLLSGELDLFILETHADSEISLLKAPYFLVLGSSNGYALRDVILELVSASGMDLTAMLDAIEPEALGGFEFKAIPFGGAFAVNDDYLVITLAPDHLRKMLVDPAGDLKVPDGQKWIYMDGPKYGAFMESAMAMASDFSTDESGGQQLMMKVYSTLFESIETEEILVKNNSESLEIKSEVGGPVMTGLYKLVHVMLQELPEMIALQKLEREKESELNEYQAAINTIDKAMMVYAENNGGFYPENVEELFSEGYMEALPRLKATEAGVFLEWGYTYHTLKNEEGLPIGYYLFLYGGDQMDGFDVYTPENLLDQENFVIARDGIADGVASFCYDGSAIKIVDQYFSR